MALSRKQISLVHVAKNRLGLEDEDYRAILWHIGGVASSKDLDARGFKMVMRYMDHLGFRSVAAQANFGPRPGMATPEQVAFIRSLWTEYTDGLSGDTGLNKWLERTFKVSALRFLSHDQAPKAITALKAMKANKARKAMKAG